MNDKSGLSRTLYDNKGNLIVSTSNNDKDIVRYEYDSNDQITKIIYPTNATATYTYDENGNIKTVTDKDGLKTTYTYDENDNEVIKTTGLIETNKRYDADNRIIRIKNEHRFTGELIDEYSYRYDSNNNIIEEIKREPYRKKVSILDIEKTEENDHTIRVTKQTFTYDVENKLTDARVERLGMKALSEPNVTTYHYVYDANGNRTTVEIKDDGLTLESTVYTYDRLNKLVSSREVTASGLYLYEYTYDDNGNLVSEDRHRQFEAQRTNIRRYEYTKDNKLESVYSGNTLLVSYTYDGDGTITSSFDRDLDLNQNLNIHDTNYINSLTNNQRQLINKVPSNDSFLYELTEYITDKNRPYSETLMERDGTGQLSTIYTNGNQRINSESYNNLSGLYIYDGRGSVSAVIGSYGDFRASYWYDGLGNVKSQIHGYGAFGSGKKYYGYNGEQYNPVTGNQNLRNRQVNIRRQRFLTEDTYIGKFTETLSINRYIYGNDNPLKFKDPSGFMSDIIMTKASKTGPGISGCGGGSQGLVSSGMILTSSTLSYGPGVDGNIQQTLFRDSIIYGFTNTQTFDQKLLDDRIDEMIKKAIEEQAANDIWWEINYQNRNKSDAELKEGEVKWIDNDVIYNKWYYGDTTTHNPWCSVFVTYNMISGKLTNKDVDGSVIENPTAIFPSFDERNTYNLKSSAGLKSWYKKENRYHSIDEVINGVDGKKYVPKKGDVMINKSINHSGIVIEYDTTNMIVKTIEGNTTKDTTNDNGYAVMVKERKLSYFDGFGDNYYIGGNRQ